MLYGDPGGEQPSDPSSDTDQEMMPEEEPAHEYEDPTNPLNDYWARAVHFSDDIADAIRLRAEKWKTCVESNGLYRQAQENYRLYMNADPDGFEFAESSFSLVGENGEFLKVRFNEFRSILTTIFNMATAQKQAQQAKAANGESASLLAAQLFDGVLDYYLTQWKRSRSTKQLNLAKELALFTPLALVLVEWDVAAGQPYMPLPNGGTIKTGDLYVKTRSFWDVWFDTNVEDEDEVDWVIVRDYYNKFDLAKRYADKEDDILSLASKNEMNNQQFWGWNDVTDLVPIYKMYHKSTSVMPEGRCTWVCDDGTVLQDGPNPYLDEMNQAVLPVLWMKATNGIGTLYGYAPGNDIAPVQKAYNMTASGIITTEAAFGVPNIYSEQGSNLTVQSIAGGMNNITGEQGHAPPSILELDGKNNRSGEVLQLLNKELGQLSGVNSVVRGDPDSALKAASGRALGLLQAQAVQAQSKYNGMCSQLDQDFSNMLLLVVRRFCQTKQITQIVGKDKVVQTAEWDGSTFAEVARVVSEPINPLAKTFAGARDEAEFMIQNGLISTPQEYLMVRNTGQLDPLFRADQAELNLISEENSDLLKGEQVPTLITDRHQWHIPEHLALCASPAVRRNSQMLAGILAHVQEHQTLLAQSQPPPVEQEQGGDAQPKPGAKKASTPQSGANAGEQEAMGPNGQPVPVPGTATVTPNMSTGGN